MLSGTSARLGSGSQLDSLCVGGKQKGILRRFPAIELSDSRSLATGDSAPLLSTLMIGIDKIVGEWKARSRREKKREVRSTTYVY